MNYQSLTFLLFSAVVLILYYGPGARLQCWVLFAANIAFFLVNGAKYLPFVLVTVLASFLAGIQIDNIYKRANERISAGDGVPKEIRAEAKKKAKRVMLLALFAALGLLVVCKYTGFALSNINAVLSKLNIPQLTMFHMIIPIGISFYTFMAVSYVLDIYWKRYGAERNFVTYASYLMYFPHVVQGPIDRFNEFKAQTENKIKFSYDKVKFGAQLALWGYFKKLVIADRIGVVVDSLLRNYKDIDGLLIILAFCLYSIQIYADFSGCIDIVSGISEMFGIKLRKNFDHPYFSRTMSEFWRRWHISLQEWFKDYVYYPTYTSQFTKNIKKRLKAKEHKRAEELFSVCFPILVVWCITGIWHGAAWKYVVWGLFHASLLIGSEVFRPVFQRLTQWFNIDVDTFGWRLWQMLRTFVLCTVGRIFFRAPRLTAAFEMIAKIATDTSVVGVVGIDFALFGTDMRNINVMIVSMLVLLLVDALQERIEIREMLAKENLVFRWIIVLLGLFSVIIFGMYGPDYNASDFIYQQF